MSKGSTLYNIGTGIEFTMEQVYWTICEILNCKPRDIIQNNSNASEINRFFLDCSKARLELDFKFEHSLRDGLSKTIAWMQVRK